MAHSFKSNQHKATIGTKLISGIQTTAKVASAAKTIYDIGKGIYSVGRVAAPMLGALILIIIINILLYI